ncbi:11101_t:CDS:2, partial [Diversispora eburnea]
LEKISVSELAYFVALRPHILNLANKIFEGNNMSSISYASVPTSSVPVSTSPVISPSEAKLLFLHTFARSIIDKFSHMINSDRDKLNTFALTSAKEIIEAE